MTFEPWLVLLSTISNHLNLKQVEPVDINSKYLEPARWVSAKDCDWWKGKLPNTNLILTLSDHMQEEGGDWKCEPWRSDQSSLPAPAPVCHHSKLDFYNHICPSHKTRLASNKCSLLRHQHFSVAKLLFSRTVLYVLKWSLLAIFGQAVQTQHKGREKWHRLKL